MKYVFVRWSRSAHGDDTAEIERYWAVLSEGAEIRQPLAPSAWAPLAGQLRDRFGVVWQLDVAAPTE
jgi:PhnB protein